MTSRGDAQEFWDENYRGRDPERLGRPHPYLVDALSGAPAGRALELGCGDGANAIWLAAQGWTVTAVDVSQVALDRAAAFARRAGVASNVRWECADLRDWTTSETFDLAAAFFVHTPLELDFPSVCAGPPSRSVATGRSWPSATTRCRRGRGIPTTPMGCSAPVNWLRRWRSTTGPGRFTWPTSWPAR